MARASQEPFERPTTFDLVAFWEAWCAQQEQDRSLYTVTLRLSPEVIPSVPIFLGGRAKSVLTDVGFQRMAIVSPASCLSNLLRKPALVCLP